ncbi:MAG: GNAT family N-acetyltransferase [Burkholderiaceae bacterium]
MAARALTLRLACAQDAPTMALMSRDLIEAGLAWRYSPQRIALLIAESETTAVVACEGSQLLGFAVMQFGDERAHLSLLCVLPAQQRRGIARRLLEWLLESAVVAGITSIHLELRADNEAARMFYRALGFSETVLVPGYYEGRYAARRMERLLRAPTPMA